MTYARSFNSTRTLILSLLACISAANAAAQTGEKTDMLGVPGPVSFQGQNYTFVWSSRPSADYIKQAYIPEGQNNESYSDMVLVEAVIGSITPIQVAAVQVQTLEARKGNDPVVNHSIIQNEATGEVLLDFLVSDMKADPIVVEWNAYRYVPLTGGGGVALFAISRRAYGEDGARSFLSGLGAARNETISALAKYDIPAMTISE